MGKPGVMIYFDILEPLSILSDSERGQLFTAILEYGRDGVQPDFSGTLAVAWGFIRPKLDVDDEKYTTSALQKRYAAYCRKVKEERIGFEEWLKLSDIVRERLITGVSGCIPSTSTTTTPSASTSTTPTTATSTTPTTQDIIKADKPPRHRFIPPVVADVEAYCLEKGYSIDAEKFVDYYMSNGWKVGRNAMRDWKAAVRTWAKSQQQDRVQKPNQSRRGTGNELLDMIESGVFGE